MRCECVKLSEENEIIQGDTYYREIRYENEQGVEIEDDAVSSIYLILCASDGTVQQQYQALNRIVSVSTSTWALGEHQIRYKITYTNGAIKTIKFKTINVVK